MMMMMMMIIIIINGVFYGFIVKKLKRIFLTERLQGIRINAKHNTSSTQAYGMLHFHN
jgi:hypothetical protein